MFWNATTITNQRVSFVGALVAGELRMTGLCELNRISRVTGHKRLQRYQAEEPSGFAV